MNTFKKNIILCFAAVSLIGAALYIRPEHRASGSVATSTLFSRPAPDVPPVIVAPVANIDERLFLVRLLEELYSEWPTNVSQPQEIQKSLGELRHRANRHYQDIKDRKLDGTIESLYSDYVSAIDVYVGFLASIGKIQSDAVARSEKESAESEFKAGYAGGTVGAQMSDNGSSGFDSVLGGAAVSLISYLWDDYNMGKARDADKQRALESAAKDIQNKLSNYIAISQNAAIKLEKQYVWGKGEAGFDESSQQAERRQSLTKANDIAGLLQIAEMESKIRPRDPFIRYRKAYYASCDNRSKPSEMLSAAKQCVEAASLVPEGRIYDEYRGWFLYAAGDIANRASSKEIGDRSWATANNSTAAYAVRLWDECLKFTPNDSTGEFGERRAWALMQSGHLKEALEQARSVEKLRQNTRRYSYNLACLLSALDAPEEAYKWFNHAVRDLGYNSIVAAKKDPDLEKMRRSKKNEFDALVAVNCTWSVDYGFMNDDLLLQNNSAFPITHVVLTARITPNRSEAPKLKADLIKPGEVFRWPNSLSVPGSKIDSTSTVSISSDQGNWP